MNCPVKTYLSAMKNRQKNPAKTTGNRYRIGFLCVGRMEGRDWSLLRSY